MTKLLEFMEEAQAEAENDPAAAVALQACARMIDLIRSPAEEDTEAKLARLVGYLDDLQYYVGRCYEAAEEDYTAAKEADDNEDATLTTDPEEDPVCG
jgi:predicted ArsR family transcriptional regulator